MSQKDRRDPSKLRVLLAGTLPPPLGGMATYYQSLISSSLPEIIELLFVQTSTHKRELSQSGRLTFSNLIDAIKDCTRFFRAILSHQPQICHIGTAFGLSFVKHGICVGIARIFDCHVLLHPHCSFSALYSHRSAWWRWCFRQVVCLTDGVIALSNEWKQVSQIVPCSQVYILHNAINLAPYLSIAQDRFENPKQDGNVNILYLGYLGRAKGSFDLIEAAHRIDCEGGNYFFDLVGDELRPGDEDHLRQAISNANLQHSVRLHSPVMGEEKLACFRNADIFVYPSYSEGLPIAVIEAMASGLPIVATNVGGLPDLVSQGVNGFLVEPGRSEQLAEALLKSINDANLRYSMGNKSIHFAREHHDIEQHVIQLVSIYKKVASNSSMG
jgi:glycosyltransferase involved in cell wall biosynthesis